MHSPSFADAYAVNAKLDRMSLSLPAIMASSNTKRAELWQVKINPGFPISTDNRYQHIAAAFKETVARTIFF